MFTHAYTTNYILEFELAPEKQQGFIEKFLAIERSKQ